MELPPYRFPTALAIARHTWQKGKQYLKKMASIILIGSLAVWALNYFPRHQQSEKNSYLNQIGTAASPIFAPQGFSWQQTVSLIAGVSAKEITASTLSVLTVPQDNQTPPHKNLEEGAADMLTMLSFLVFTLLYSPCLATLAAIKAETGKWRWAAFAATYTTLLAWTISALVKQVGLIFVSLL